MGKRVLDQEAVRRVWCDRAAAGMGLDIGIWLRAGAVPLVMPHLHRVGYVRLRLVLFMEIRRSSHWLADQAAAAVRVAQCCLVRVVVVAVGRF